MKEVGNLESLTNLVNLVLTGNKFLSSPNFRKNINLISLFFNDNRPSFGHLIKKKSLNCQGLKNLEYLDCSFSSLEELNVNGCINLKVIDADGNFFKGLYFPYLPSLVSISLLGNNHFPYHDSSLNSLPANKILTLQSPNLKYLVTRKSDIKEVIHKRGLNNLLQVIDDETYEKLYKSTEVAIQAWERQVDETMANSNELDLIRHLFGDTHIDHEQKEKEVEAQIADEDNKELIITDPSLLTNNHPNLINDEEEQTLTHKFLIETLIVENKPKLKSLNIGNNYLSYLVVRNCPQLTTLRYAHNKLRHDAFIENCPNLITIDKENYAGQKVWDEVGEEQFQKGELKPQIANDKKKEEQEAPQPRPIEEEKTADKLPSQMIIKWLLIDFLFILFFVSMLFLLLTKKTHTLVLKFIGLFLLQILIIVLFEFW
ncbi:MAG: hypothetical protein GBAus27B_000062 [Mycoplasmataceae bacterium]|nr:MAG: hypothetical protein GBAus27B_000062 [Mycoplasmataceae bacterium]